MQTKENVRSVKWNYELLMLEWTLTLRLAVQSWNFEENNLGILEKSMYFSPSTITSTGIELLTQAEEPIALVKSHKPFPTWEDAVQPQRSNVPKEHKDFLSFCLMLSWKEWTCVGEPRRDMKWSSFPVPEGVLQESWGGTGQVTTGRGEMVLNWKRVDLD